MEAPRVQVGPGWALIASSERNILVDDEPASPIDGNAKALSSGMPVTSIDNTAEALSCDKPINPRYCYRLVEQRANAH